MDSTGLQHLDWVNYHHISRNPDTMKPLPNQSSVSSLYSPNQENLHLNNTIKDYSDGKELDQQNLNILESEENSCDRLENNTTLTNDGDNELWDTNSGFQELKNSYNNNITSEDFPRIDFAKSDSIFDEDPQQLSEPTKSTDLKYDLSCLHLSDRGSQFRRIRDVECESVSSDYSEVVGPLRDLADNEIEIFNSNDLEETISEKCNSFSTRSETLQQNPNETDEEFHKRVKKVNFLSLAQEFAELKKIDADVLPFDLHKTDFSDYSPMSEESSFTESTMTSPADLAETPTDAYDFVRDENSNELDTVDCCDTEGLQTDSDGRLYKSDSAANSYKANVSDVNNLDVDVVANSKHSKPNVALWENKQNKNSEVKNDTTGVDDYELYDIEDTLPKMDWETLEQQLALVVEEKSHCNDREEIRRKLAMGGDEDLYNTDRLYRKANAQSRYSTGMNLQLCFMSEKPAANPGATDVGSTEPAPSSNENVASQQKLPSSSSYRNFSDLKSNWSRHLRDHNMQQVAPPKPPRKKVDAENEEEDFFKKQAQLQEEAKLALAQASTMAHMQLEVEKQMKKKSPIAEMVGIPGFGDGRQKRLERKFLLDMNVAQLQVIVNDLLSQIKSLNEDLVQMLLDRDDLHMEQDSMLVDIEDLTRRTQEFAKKINSKQKKDKKK